MQEQATYNNGGHGGYGVWITAAIVLVVMWILTSCKSQATLPVTDYHGRDSIRTEYVHDSIYIDKYHNVYTKGDTVYQFDSIYLYVAKHDTVTSNIALIDTIYKRDVVEKPLTNRQIFLQRSGIALWIILTFAVLAAVAFILAAILRFFGK